MEFADAEVETRKRSSSSPPSSSGREDTAGPHHHQPSYLLEFLTRAQDLGSSLSSPEKDKTFARLHSGASTTSGTLDESSMSNWPEHGSVECSRRSEAKRLSSKSTTVASDSGVVSLSLQPLPGTTALKSEAPLHSANGKGMDMLMGMDMGMGKGKGKGMDKDKGTDKDKGKGKGKGKGQSEDSCMTEPSTTFMLGNLPYRARKKDIMAALDHMGFKGTYNFCHVPNANKRKPRPTNLGYAFVGFSQASSAAAFSESFGNFCFLQISSEKRCTLKPAHWQSCQTASNLSI